MVIHVTHSSWKAQQFLQLFVRVLVILSAHLMTSGNIIRLEVMSEFDNVQEDWDFVNDNVS